MTISQVSRRCEISSDTLRYYEKLGLLTNVRRTASGLRDYCDEDCERIELIKSLRSGGIGIEAISEYFNHLRSGDDNARRRLIDEQRNLLSERLTAIGDTIALLDELQK